MSTDDVNISSDIIERCKKGEVQAQFIIYRQYSKAMYNIAIRMVSNRMDAEDILQESFITAFEKLPDLISTAAFGSWLKRIVINRCVDHIRKTRIVFGDTDIHNTIDTIDEEPSAEPDPAMVHNAIKKLPDGGRTILVLHALEGYRHREIAQMLGISESTSKTQYKRALSLLNKELKNKIYAT